MKRIHAVNAKVLPYPVQQIWRVITDFDGYSKWWPSSIRTKVIWVSETLIGSRIEVRPYGGRGFICEVVGVTEHSELRMKYSGIYRGIGGWTLSDVNEHCRVTYKIMLEIDDLWIRLLSYILPVTKIHARLMTKVLSGLERYLAKDYEKQEPPNR
jgi:ribosome-associated toxin RatA of RatAB toxin-antitoxin module